MIIDQSFVHPNGSLACSITKVVYVQSLCHNCTLLTVQYVLQYCSRQILFHVIFELCVYVPDILRKFDDMIEVILPQLPTSFDTVTDPEGKAALIWILGEYGEVYCVHFYSLFSLLWLVYCSS